MSHVMNTYKRLPRRARARRRLLGVGQTGQTLSRRARGHRGVRARPQPPRAGARRSADAGRQADPHARTCTKSPLQEELADRLAAISGMDEVFFCNSGCEANEAAIKIARLLRPRQRHRHAGDHRDGKSVSRPHHCDAVGNRQPQGAGRLRTAGARFRARAVRRSRRGQESRREQPQRGRGAGRTDPGRRRHQYLPRRLPARPARNLRRQRLAADARRSAKRHRPHRPLVRVPAFRRQARRDDARQRACLRRADRRLSRRRAGGRRVQARQSRLDVRRQSARVRRGARHARHHRERKPDGKRHRDGRFHPRGAARRARWRRRRAGNSRHGADDRHRTRLSRATNSCMPRSTPAC